MNISKLKLENFKNILSVNFPYNYKIDHDTAVNDIEVIIYYIDKLEDVKDFVKLCENTPLPEANRTIMVYRKGRKDGVNRDSIFMPFGDNPHFQLKAPMLCSLSDELSACVMSRIVKK